MSEQEELIQSGILRDLRCPACQSRKLSSSSGIFVPMVHTCVDCGAQCTDEQALAAAQQARETDGRRDPPRKDGDV